MDSKLPTPEELQRIIAEGLSCEWLKVSGDGQHFEAMVVSSTFEGRSRLERHRMVYATLGDRMRQRVHALSMRTLTPAEYRQAAAG